MPRPTSLAIIAVLISGAVSFAADAPKERLFPAGAAVGAVRDIAADGKSFKVEVEFTVPKVESNGRITPEKKKETVEFLFADDVKIRVPPKIEKDDNGRPKPYKPDPSDKDYRRFPNTAPGSSGDILKGHIVKVEISTTKPAGKELPRTMVTAVIVVGEEKR